MMAEVVIAADTANFGQPETNLCQSVSREHSLFQILTTTEDTTEGIKAVIGRSAGNWKGH